MALNDLNSLPFHCLDDNEFLHVIFEQQHGSVHYDSDRLASLKFNLLLTDVYCHQRLTTTYNLDPDANFHAGSNICDYLIEERFNEIIKSRINNRDNFSLLHLNIRSLQANLDRLTELLSCLSSQFSVIAITETWLHDTNHLVDIENYNFIHKHCTSSYGGGIGLYLSKQLPFKNRPDLCLESNNNNIVESLFIEICNPNGKNIIVGVLYRPPASNVNLFVQKFDDLLGKISSENNI